MIFSFTASPAQPSQAQPPPPGVVAEPASQTVDLDISLKLLSPQEPCFTHAGRLFGKLALLVGLRVGRVSLNPSFGTL